MTLRSRIVKAAVEWFIPRTRWSNPAARAWRLAYRVASVAFVWRSPVHRYAVEVDGERHEVVGIGAERRFRPLFERLFGELEPLPDEPAGSHASLTAVEVHPWTVARWRRRGFLIAPQQVRWMGDLDEVPPAKPGKSLRSDLRRLSRHTWSVECERGRDAWESFLRDMVAPHARTRFGEAAWVPSRTFRRYLRRHGWVLRIHRDGKEVAGTSLLMRGDEAWCPLLGVQGGDDASMRDGAITACYATVARQARSRGARTLDYGRGDGFIDGGISYVKRKWGFRPTPEPLAHLLALDLGPASAALAGAFERDPIWLLEGSRLEPYPAPAGR